MMKTHLFTSGLQRVRTLVLIMAIVASTLTSALAQKTDLSGQWNLNRESSQLMTDFTMAPQTVTIVQKGDSLIVEKEMNMMGQAMNSLERYKIDGNECSNPGFMDATKVSEALWNDEGLVLTINSTMAFQGESLGMTEIFYLDDGGHLTIDYSMESSMGEMSEVYVFDKM
jgi:hypothetical protein